jgi:hypothetical protein
LISVDFKLRLCMLIMKNKHLYGISLINTNLPSILLKNEQITVEANACFKNVPKGNYKCFISLLQRNIPPVFNSKAFDVRFK